MKIKIILKKILSAETYNKIQWVYNRIKRYNYLNYCNKENFNQKYVLKNLNKKQAADLQNTNDSKHKDKIIVSIIIVTFNNLKLTKKTLESIELFSNFDNYEIIIVDNKSTDGTRKFLKNYSQNKANIHLIYNTINAGFSAGNNIGIKKARGQYIALLNNDVYVTPGWIAGLLRHFKSDAMIGMVGPRTNNIGNSARLETFYNNVEEMINLSMDLYEKNCGKSYSINVLAFFCVIIKKEVFDKIGLLDEVYGIGLFEDDDFCHRAKLAGYKLICANDVFVHHHLSASIDKMGYKKKQELFERNKSIYEAKYGKWSPHSFTNDNI